MEWHRAEQRVQRCLRVEFQDGTGQEPVGFLMNCFNGLSARPFCEAEDRPIGRVEPVRVVPHVVFLLDSNVDAVRFGDLLGRDTGASWRSRNIGTGRSVTASRPDTVGTVEQPELAGSLRDRFSITHDDLLGFGGEAAIYALDEQQVVRCYRAGTDPRKVEVRAAFYEGIAWSGLPFKLPVVESIGDVDGWLYSIEERIPGTSLTTALGVLEGTERSHA